MMPKSFNMAGNCSSDDQSYYYKSGKKKDCDNRNHRSQSEPPKHMKNSRGAQRGHDDCCADPTDNSHNSMKVLTVGVDPRQMGTSQYSASCCADHTASGSKQRLWLAQQLAQQQQLQRQQQMMQMQQQNQQNCYNTFQPNMNSTMMSQQQKQACQQKQQACQQQQQLCQQQQQLCQQQQQPCQLQQHQSAARAPSAQNRCQAHSSRATCCPIQQQQQQKYPTKSPRCGNLQQYEVCSSFEQNNSYKACNQSQPKQSSCCQQRGTSPSVMQREVTFDHASGSCAVCQTTAPRKANSPCSTLRPDALPGNMSPEELYVQRANTLFMDMLVLDRTYPGVIQDTLDGNADFNNLSFQIAFADKIPSKPYPVEPISLLEAIQMRIDFERDDIERKLHIRMEKEENPECRKDKDKEKPRGMYYGHEDKMSKAQGQRFQGGCSKCGHLITNEDIDKHFDIKNKSEVNDAVRAFLKAQNDHTKEESAFSAHINSHESDFFGSPIKMKVYNATTWPKN